MQVIPARGLKLIIDQTESSTVILVAMQVIPARGLKLACGKSIQDCIDCVAMQVIPARGLKQGGEEIRGQNIRVAMQVIPARGLKQGGEEIRGQNIRVAMQVIPARGLKPEKGGNSILGLPSCNAGNSREGFETSSFHKSHKILHALQCR